MLEVSATPYLYSLRFYDWLRRAARTVHSVRCTSSTRSRTSTPPGPARRWPQDLVQRPRTVRHGDGWREEVIGSLPEMFFDVRRIVLETEDPADDDTDGRFHVINVVEGDGVMVETADGHRHALAYAETLTIPAAVGPYTMYRLGTAPVRVVKALVR